tara:strand:- start:654 stop:896 length:243 start_codon:yes stop_codon:yes gene_type:complete
MLNKDKFLSLISKALKVPKSKIKMSLKVGEIEEWDSLGHLEILTKIDKETKGKAGKIKNLSSSQSLNQIYENLKKNKLIK